MPSKKPLRSTQLVQLRVLPTVAKRLERNARAMGLTMSDYASALIQGEAPFARPAADMSNLGLIGNRMAKVVNLLEVEEFDRLTALRFIREAQRFLFAETLNELPRYEAARTAQCLPGDDVWGDA